MNAMVRAGVAESLLEEELSGAGEHEHGHEDVGRVGSLASDAVARRLAAGFATPGKPGEVGGNDSGTKLSR